ncbi:sulfotransferase [Rhodanobacter sp. Soil772]|uniref:tetratricopeptide repeat-containing sulfotransferase family protein n=1 Tax=Rhodanobacter sp. Soil772 TaxID=1736406 RepID=UPI0009E986C4|nr:sulfotransferase [Rhodanobacter sp. Soil772]
MSDATTKYWDRAQRYLLSGQKMAARIALESLLQRNQVHVPSMLALHAIALEDGRVQAATTLALTAVNHMQDDPVMIVDVVDALLQVGETVVARDALDHDALARVNDVAMLARLAKLRRILGDHEGSLALLNRADAAGMNSPEFRFDRAHALIFNGHLQEGEAELEASLRLRPLDGMTTLSLARVRKQTAERNHLDRLRLQLQQVASGGDDEAILLFALYKELEDLGRHDEAWNALERANATMYARQDHDPDYAWHLFNGLIERCTPEFLQPAEVVHEGPQPIFIIGMPRSGTTLMERVISNHSQVTSAGELYDFGMQLRWAADNQSILDECVVERLPGLDYVDIGRRYLSRTQWRARGARFFVDKMPRNWMLAGMIHRALPQARILSMVRDPMDVCFSNFRTWVMGESFPWNYDLQALAAHYLQYRKVLAHWHATMPGVIHDVSYSELVRDPETTTRKALAFCGLEWEPGCVDITSNKAVVATLSAAQVREPIHQRFFQEWRHYEKQLQSLYEAVAL